MARDCCGFTRTSLATSVESGFGVDIFAGLPADEWGKGGLEGLFLMAL
jgi:hypothetical protein